MTVFYGKRYNDNFRIRGTDTYQVECGIIVCLAHDEVTGIRAFGAHMEILFFHRLNLTPHSPIIKAMTSDDLHDCKFGNYTALLQALAPESPPCQSRIMILAKQAHRHWPQSGLLAAS